MPNQIKETCPYCGKIPHLAKCAFSGKPEAGDNDIFDWQTQLEYALPDKLTAKEKQVIKNSVEVLLAQEKEKWMKKVIDIIKKKKIGGVMFLDTQIEALLKELKKVAGRNN